jgi:hypothetical protein
MFLYAGLMSKAKAIKLNLFTELMQGVDAMKGRRERKVALRTHKLPVSEIKESPGAEPLGGSPRIYAGVGALQRSGKFDSEDDAL